MLHRLCIILCAMLCIEGVSRAQSQTAGAGEEFLRQMESAMSALGNYEVRFGVASEGYSASGRYVVCGKDFYLSTEDVELYVADGVKYEVNSTKREITVDGIESLGSDIVSNPTRGLTSLLKDFTAELVTHDARRAVRLTPRGESGASERILVVENPATRMPSEIRYISGDGSVAVLLKSVAAWREPLPRFDRAKYADYELVELR